MIEEDIPAVSRLERKCFSNPWPQSAYRRELRNVTQNYYIVLRDSGHSLAGSYSRTGGRNGNT